MLDSREQKRALRRRVLAERDALDEPLRARLSERAREHLQSLEAYRRARCVHLFVSFGSEVETGPLLEALWREGRRAILPRVAPGRRLQHAEVRASMDLAPGFRGIPEPLAGCPTCGPESVDLVVVPGLAFDREGGRLGYGGGYYDRFLAACPAPRVALAFSVQLVDRVPREPHDLLVHRVVTEDGVIEASPGQ